MKTFLAIGCIGLGLAAATAAVAAEDEAKEDAKLDAKLGLAEETFVINLAALRTRTDLREAARIRTGLPSYDQQVENAEGSPASLLAELRQVVAPERRAPPPVPAQSSSASNDQSSEIVLPNCPITHVGPCP